ncbi:MAG: HEAT repeat domain-containing protein [Planctomycetota bacterium]
MTLLLALPCVAPAQDRPEGAEALATEAAYLEEFEGELEKASALYREALTRTPGFARGRARQVTLRLAIVLERLGKDREALLRYRELLRNEGPEPDLTRAAAHARLTSLERRLGEQTTPRSPVEDALDRLESADPEERYGAIRTLQALPQDDVVPPLVRRLRAESPKIRHYAVLLSGNLGDKRAVAPLQERLDDPLPDIACNAALALYKLGDEGGRPTLLRALDHPSVSVRLCAASHLTHFGSAAGAEVLIDELLSAELYRRETALRALQRLSLGETHGYDPEEHEEGRRQASDRWRIWLQQR